MKRLYSKIMRFGASLVLAFSSLLFINFGTALAIAPYTCTWTGGGNGTTFSDSANWSGCNSAAPVAGDGDSLVFDAASITGTLDATDDIASLSVANITVQGTNAGFYGVNINGTQPLTITGNISDSVTGTSLDFKNPVVLNGNPTINAPSAFVTLGGVVSGTGNITLTDGYLFLNGDNTYTGNLTANGGQVLVGTATALGNSANLATINAGAEISIGDCTDSTGFTVANPITLTGASSDPANIAKLFAGASCHGGGGAAVETYGSPLTTQDYTISGTVTLGSDVTFGSIAKSVTLTGALSGNFKFTLPTNWSGPLTVSSSSNTSGMANGTYAPNLTVTLSDNQASNTVYIGANATITVDGTRSDTSVASGGVLRGIGTVGALDVQTGGTVAPGHSPGCLNTGNLLEGGTYSAEIGGTTACTGYDQLNVTGTVNLTNGTLNTSLYNSYVPKVGETYTIINNDGSDAVTGTFTGLPEGATFTVSGYVFQISYVGGDGNDVVLTVKSVPASPDTGFGLILSNPLVGLAGTLMMAGGFYVLSKKAHELR